MFVIDDAILAGALAITAAASAGSFIFNLIGNNQQNEYQQTQLDVQQNVESTNILDQYYDTEAAITSVEDKVTDAFANIKILVKNIDVIKSNETTQINQLLTADKKQQGMIFSSGYSNGFLMSETAEIIKSRNTEQIKADIENVQWNASVQADAQKIKIDEFESFINKYYGKDEFSALLSGVGDVNGDNMTDVYDLVGYDISDLDFTNAGGYLGELQDRLDQLQTQMNNTSKKTPENITLETLPPPKEVKKLPKKQQQQAVSVALEQYPVINKLPFVNQVTGWVASWWPF